MPYPSATFPNKPTSITRGDLAGPFSGYVLDASGVALSGVPVRGCWVLDPPHNPGFCIDRKTKNDGSYAFPRMSKKWTPLPLKSLRDFRLFAYADGYWGYRSDKHEDGAIRRDFTQRSNVIYLRRFSMGMSHENHLAFLSNPPHNDAWLKTVASNEWPLVKREEEERIARETAAVAPPAPPPTPPPWTRAHKTLLAVIQDKAFPKNRQPWPAFAASPAENVPEASSQLAYSGILLRMPATPDQAAPPIEASLQIWTFSSMKEASQLLRLFQKKAKPFKSRKTKEGQWLQTKIKGGFYGSAGLLAQDHVVWRALCGASICKTQRSIDALSTLLAKWLKTPEAIDVTGEKPTQKTP